MDRVASIAGRCSRLASVPCLYQSAPGTLLGRRHASGSLISQVELLHTDISTSSGVDCLDAADPESTAALLRKGDIYTSVFRLRASTALPAASLGDLNVTWKRRRCVTVGLLPAELIPTLHLQSINQYGRLSSLTARYPLLKT